MLTPEEEQQIIERLEGRVFDSPEDADQCAYEIVVEVCGCTADDAVDHLKDLRDRARIDLEFTSSDGQLVATKPIPVAKFTWVSSTSE